MHLKKQKRYQRRVIDISEAVRGFFKKTFVNFCVDGPALDLQHLKASRLMISCTHRSQADYFVLGQVLFDLGVENMRFAAGDNLTRLPVIGRLFRKLGAFSVKRRGILGRNYVRRLCERVVSMLNDGDRIVVFPEGGRSYQGHMMEVKSGIIGAGVLAQARNPSAPVLFLPMAISYERLPELLYFNMLEKGKRMRDSARNPIGKALGSILYFGADVVAFSKFLVAHYFEANYGNVYVDYGEPMALDAVADWRALAVPGARDDFMAHRVTMQAVSTCMHRKFVSLYRILPMHVVAGVLRERGGKPRSQLPALCSELLTALAAQGRNLKSVERLSPEQVVEEGLRQLDYTGCLSQENGYVGIRKPWIVRYYAATVENADVRAAPAA